MESSLETVALFALKLAYETEGQSPILRDDPVMSDYQRDVFDLLVRNRDVGAIQRKMNACITVALDAVGGTDKPLGRELHRLATDFSQARTTEEMNAPLVLLKDYLKDIQ
ncbi:hypothetical protein ACW9IK_03395 [Pseudomonas gingeri]|uniref:hypothetical protein n=1 Tax=Pseudomonas TaxID=286 RepID=UPI0015A3CD3E|nr:MULTISPECIES: hypothetical protein [Pseudomonas]NVZ60912.1 hypothetical protein [Pseudomonas gingeri]NVZ76758.1 hypothetical protein [Pseudomonas gingeri]BBP79198.1 hypothetical protein PHLH7_53020 [Pseudomonas sp. Ost2]